MNLPKIDMPLFSVTLPSTGQELNFRPFRVKEEKLLLIAKESNDPYDINLAIRQMIQNCIMTENFNVEKIAIFDLEYLFIKIRAVSVSNIVKFSVKDSDDDQEYELEVDLNKVEIQTNPNHNKKIEINDKIGLVLKYPNTTIMEKIKGLTSFMDITVETIDHCIDYAYDEENVYPWNEATKDEKEQFIDNLSIENYNKIQDFFSSIPKLEHIVYYTNSEGKEKKVVFRTLFDFFEFC